MAFHNRAARALSLCTLLLMLTVCCNGAWARDKRPFIAPASLATFDGATWSGLTLGKTTREEIEKQLRTRDYHGGVLGLVFHDDVRVMRSSIELTPEKKSPTNIELLMSSDKKEAVLVGIMALNAEGGANLDELANSAGEAGVDCYYNGRLEDWRYVVYPQKGIVAFVAREAGHDRVHCVALCLPPAIKALTRYGKDKPTAIEERIDPNAEKPRVMDFGLASLTVNVRGVTMEERERRREERALQYATAHDTIRYRPGATGTYLVTVSGQVDQQKGGSLTVECKISGDGPYGLVTASGSSTKSLPAVKRIEDAYSEAESTNYTIALYEARSKAEREFADAMKNSGPPPLWTIRADLWRSAQELIRFSGSKALQGEAADEPGKS